jgi:hypothetical protein
MGMATWVCVDICGLTAWRFSSKGVYSGGIELLEKLLWNCGSFFTVFDKRFTIFLQQVLMKEK